VAKEIQLDGDCAVGSEAEVGSMVACRDKVTLKVRFSEQGE
jgi:hypothetical protein